MVKILFDKSLLSRRIRLGKAHQSPTLSYSSTEGPKASLCKTESDPSPSSSTACVIIRDEREYILEWIAYHEIIGFDRFIVYDNGSSDGTIDILAPLDRCGRIDYVWWPDRPGVVPQLSAYKDAISKVSTEWVSFLDVDEFLNLKSITCIGDFLRRFPTTVGGVAINWKMFGSSGLRSRQPGLVIERFTRCADLSHGAGPNSEYGFAWQVKSVARVRAIESVSFHVHKLKPQFYYTNPSGQDYLDHSIDFEVAQVNHYAVKSWEEFLAKSKKNRANFSPEKNAKGEYWEPDPEAAGSCYFQAYDLNAMEDVDMLSFSIRVHDRIAQLQHIIDNA